MPDYDDPEIEEQWCNEQREVVTAYLLKEKVPFNDIGEWPAFHLAPYLSLWAVESREVLGSIGWWALCGDIPLDHISAADIELPQHPRKALRVFSKNWREIVRAWDEGKAPANVRLGSVGDREVLGPLLTTRAKFLLELADDDELWKE